MHALTLASRFAQVVPADHQIRPPASRGAAARIAGACPETEFNPEGVFSHFVSRIKPRHTDTPGPALLAKRLFLARAQRRT